MARFIFYALVIFLLYKLIFDFIIPIFTVTRKMRNQFDHTKKQMDENFRNASQQNADQGTTPTPKKANKAGEYIEFEEIGK
jgi:hypothetical protein